MQRNQNIRRERAVYLSCMFTYVFHTKYRRGVFTKNIFNELEFKLM